MKIRDFNTLELMSWILSLSSPHNGIVAFRLNEKGDLPKLQCAVNQAIKIQPMTSVTIRLDEPGFFVTKSNSTIKKIDDHKELKEIFDEELKLRFNYGDSLIRFLYINNLDYVICVFHHVIADAVSCIKFLENVLKIYHNKPSSGNIHGLSFPDFLDIRPKLDVSSLIKNDVCKNSTKTDYMVFNSDTYVKIKKKFDNKFISVNSQIVYFLFQAACESFDLDHYTVNMPFNLRRFDAGVSDERLSFFTSYISYEVNLKNTMEDVSKMTKIEFLKNTPMKNVQKTNTYINNISSSKDFIDSFSSNQPLLIISSNRIDEEDHLNCVTELLVFVSAQNFFSSSNSFTIQYGLTKNSLSICISYPYPLVLPEKINLFFDKLKKLLV